MVSHLRNTSLALSIMAIIILVNSSVIAANTSRGVSIQIHFVDYKSIPVLLTEGSSIEYELIITNIENTAFQNPTLTYVIKDGGRDRILNTDSINVGPLIANDTKELSTYRLYIKRR